MTRVLRHWAAAALAVSAVACPAVAGSLFNPRTMIRTVEVRPGMRGIAKTVFRGTEITSFDVEVIGVLEKYKLGGDAVLIRVLDGPVVERASGIVRGMSGSPVYIDGRLLGAISFGYLFSKEPIGGVTPVEDMLEAIEHPGSSASPPSAQASAIPAKIGGRTVTRAAISGFGADAAALTEDHRTIVMQPLGTALTCSGFSQRALQSVGDALASYGVEPVAGPGPMPEKDWVDVNLEPGCAVGIKMMDGDFTAAVTGTLTYRDKNVVLAFGHPFLQSGRVDMPLATAWVHDIIPSVEMSNRMSSLMKTVGAIQQDRAWSVAGLLGAEADMVSVNVEIRDRTRDLTKKYHVEVVQHEDMTVPMILAGLFNAVDATYKPSGRGTARVRFTVRTEDGHEVSRENLFYSTVAVGDTTVTEAAQALTILTKNQYDRQKIASVDIVSEITDEDRSATIEDVYAEQPVAKADEDLVLHVRLKQQDKPPIEEVVTLKIPEEVRKGAMRIGVTGGGGERALEARLGITQPDARSLPDLIERIQKTQANNRLVVMAALPNPTFRVSNREMSSLPSSVAGTLARSKWTDLRQGKEKIAAYVDTDYVLIGQKTLSIAIEDKQGKKGKAPPSRPPSAPAPSRSPNAKTPASNIAWASEVGDIESTASRFGPRVGAHLSEATEAGSQHGKEAKPKASTRNTEAGEPEKKPEEKKKEKKPTPAVTRQSSEWLQTKFEDFEKGEAKGLALVSTGEIVLSPQIEKLKDTGEFYLWSATSDAQGNAYFGSGPNGVIYKLTPDGELSTFYDSDEVAVHALAFDSAGYLIAGTAPDGRILRIDPSGKGTVLYDADCQYVWALAPHGDDIYAGCGPGARVLKISRDGTATEFAKLPAAHVLSLAFSGDALYAGTANDGVVYRIDRDGKHVAVFGANEKSVCALAVGPGGNVYAGTEPGGLLVRISPDGSFEVLHDSDERGVLSLLADGDVLYAATGDGGRLLRISDRSDGEPAIAQLGEMKLPQGLCMTKAKDGSLLVGTGNMGAIVRVAIPQRASGHFDSDALDAKMASQWGAISWVADLTDGADVYLQTRSGNTPDPDDEWSPWSRAYVNADGETIASPPGRYLQYRVNVVGSSGASPVVRSIKVLYLPANQKPTLTVGPPKEGDALSGEFELKWKAEDPDKDKLLYGIYTSKEDDRAWKAVKEELEEPKYKWDTKKVEDGRYALRITASDELSNPADPQVRDEVLEPIVIDNTAPKIIEKKVGEPDANHQVAISGLAADDLTRITAIEYRAGDKGPFRGVAPSDGMYDALTERFDFKTVKLEGGEQTIHLRVRDAAGNWGTEDIAVKIEEEKKAEEKPTAEEGKEKRTPAKTEGK